MSSSFWYSLLGHILIGLLFFISLPTFQKQQTPLDSVPVFIDLKNMEITDKTNLPAKVEKPAEPKTVVKEEKQPAKIETRKIEPVKEVVEPVQKTEPVKDAVKTVVPEPVKKPVPVVKPKPKVPVKAPTVKPKPVKAKPKEDDGLDSLLASVEKMSKTNNPAPKKKDEISDLVAGVLDGVEKGPTHAPIGNKLSVSQIDFIKAKVREKWIFDAGIDGIDKMIVELRVYLSRDGRVSDVEILDKKRYDQDASFRSVAESAKRAVNRCDKDGEESPFRMLALRYPERYSDWQQLRLSFSPMDDGAI